MKEIQTLERKAYKSLFANSTVGENMEKERANKSKSKKSRHVGAGMTLGDYFLMSPEIAEWLGLSKPQPYPITSSSNNIITLNNVQIKTFSPGNNVSVKDVQITTSSNHVPKTLDLLRKFNNDLNNGLLINDLKDALQQRKVINNVIFGKHYVFKITHLNNNVMNVIPMTYNHYKFDELTITFDNDEEKQLLNNALKNDKDNELNEIANDLFNALKNDNITNVIGVLNNVRKTNLIYGKKYDYKLNEFELRNNNGNYELTMNVIVMTKDKHEKLYDLSITFDDNDLKKIGSNNGE
jgi:hypothetical protein